MSWIEDLRDHLADNELGTVGTDLFVGDLPDGELVGEPTRALRIQPGVVSYTGGGAAVREPGLELTCRAQSFDTAWAAAEATWKFLAATRDITVGATRFLAINALSDIEDEGRDENDRQVFTARFTVWL